MRNVRHTDSAVTMETEPVFSGLWVGAGVRSSRRSAAGVWADCRDVGAGRGTTLATRHTHRSNNTQRLNIIVIIRTMQCSMTTINSLRV